MFDVFVEAAEGVVGFVQFAPEFGNHAVALPQLVAKPVDIVALVVVVGWEPLLLCPNSGIYSIAKTLVL